jgi:hypothetical protein
VTVYDFSMSTRSNTRKTEWDLALHVLSEKSSLNNDFASPHVYL